MLYIDNDNIQETHTLEETGSLYNLSRQRVNEIEQNALDRLRLTIRR